MDNASTYEVLSDQQNNGYLIVYQCDQQCIDRPHHLFLDGCQHPDISKFYSYQYLFGAPRQNRTAITGLQNQCNAIILVGRVC